MSEPVTREEQFLSAIAAGGDILSPITRQEMYLAYLAGDTSISLPEPVTRKEQFLYQACLSGGSGGEGITPVGTKSITENGIYDVMRYANADVNVPTEEINNQDKTITANGEYTADAGYTGLGTVTVSVPASAAPAIQPLSITENGTYEASDGVDGYSPVTVNVEASGGDDSWESVIVGSGTIKWPSGITKIPEYLLYNVNTEGLIIDEIPDSVENIGNWAFGASFLCTINITKLPANLITIGDNCFRSKRFKFSVIPSSVKYIGSSAFYYNPRLEVITFRGTPTRIDPDAFGQCGSLLTINVPWAEGEVANAPWGATKATINYNYAEEG